MTFPFPSRLAVTPCSVKLFAEGLTEDGAPNIKATWNGNVIYSERFRTVIDATSKKVTLIGRIILEGDIAPQIKAIADGEATVNGKVYKIYSGARPRNPDGTIHHTTLELQ